jgi:hypothetical protein
MHGRQFYQALSALVDTAEHDPHAAALATETLEYCLEEMRVLQTLARHRERVALRRWARTGLRGDKPGVIIIE